MNILVAMSGGVDSSVAAALLKEQGHRVIGATLRLLKKTTGFGCCGSTRDIDDARAVCAKLDVPHYVLDFSETFAKNIMDPFVDSYLNGRTPNPCIACNRFVKFDALLDKALALGADRVATGHYARVETIPGENGPIHRLRRAVDRSKDQSYVLYPLGQKELSKLMFPIGSMTKGHVRDAARRFGLKTADKAESMEICFVPEADTASFVRKEAEKKELQALTVRPGYIKDRSGKVLGLHKGAAFYTRGQREGLGIALGRPVYVVDVNAETNTIVVGDDADTKGYFLWADDLRWTRGRPEGEDFGAYVQIRSRPDAIPAMVRLRGPEVEVETQLAMRAASPGQAIVFYNGDEVLGGGTICRVPAPAPAAEKAP